MAKYGRKEYRLGEWYLSQREGSPAWYANRYDPEAQQNRRQSLDTVDFEQAKAKLYDLHLKTRTVRDEKADEAPLADVLRRYWEGHASKLRSAASNRHCLNVWREYWGNASVGKLQSIQAQEAFHAWMRGKDYTPSAMMRVIAIGKAAINRAHKRGELVSPPRVLTVKVGRTEPMGRPLELAELRAVYANAVPHLQAYMRWALGTGARPEAILELQASQIDPEHRLVDLNPRGRKQSEKKYRPTVKLPAFWEPFDGLAVAYEGKAVKSVKKALWRACDRGGVKRCSPYSFRHTAARWMRKRGVEPWQVACQLGHSGGKEYAVTERYAFYSPEYLADAARALDELVALMIDKNNSCVMMEKVNRQTI